ncbi:hypothetical protein [Nocardioides sp. NPDC127503]|uniref:hypothetical protein n=1 Tax=Nocardioides sp. NPDC127503 TaxID=3154516 RepID=UPI0033204457
MDPFTWFLIAAGVVIVGAILWLAVRKSSGGVDEAVANRNRGQALGKGEYYAGPPHGGSDAGPPRRRLLSPSLTLRVGADDPVIGTFAPLRSL